MDFEQWLTGLMMDAPLIAPNTVTFPFHDGPAVFIGDPCVDWGSAGEEPDQIDITLLR
ncbi:MAG TPA: hypothetical protein VKE95_10265 [Burkholderiales bacterium]|nr:hypothetical protein [Burkholderiales bacterium]